MNSLGHKYAEQCVTCEHSGLCFRFLELAGSVTQDGQPIFSGCADVRNDSEKMQKVFEEIIERWQKQIARAHSGSTANAEGCNAYTRFLTY